MEARRTLPSGIWIALGWLVWANPLLLAEEPYRSMRLPTSERTMPSYLRSPAANLPVSLDQVPARTRESILKVLQQPTLKATAPREEFAVSPQMYVWLLEHPDRVSLAWRRMKVAAIHIEPIEGGRFAWKDERGSEMVWKTVAQNGDGRIWYAEGKICPGALLPSVPVRAVAVLHHRGFQDADGQVTIRHHVDVYLQSDSAAANLVLRMLGPSAPKMAEQGAEQLLLFFSGIARYVERNPEKADILLAEKPSR